MAAAIHPNSEREIEREKEIEGESNVTIIIALLLVA
jgi:hypothetical protein